MKPFDSPLRQALSRRSQELYQRTVAVVQTATPLLWHSIATFPGGTSHTPEHTKSVERLASLLVAEDVLSQLTEYEIATLILACHFHDLGMVGTDEQNMTAEGREGVRRDHAISIGNQLKQNWQKLGFATEVDADILADVCRGHRPAKDGEGRAIWDDIPAYSVAGIEEAVRTRLVAAIVYAADELHLDHGRATKREQEWVQISDPSSVIHWERHQAIRGPAMMNGALVFEVTAATSTFEKDLRQVFRKALLAVTDLRLRVDSELKGPATVPRIELSWKREGQWKLLCLLHLLGLNEEPIDNLCSNVAARHTALVPTEDLDSLCTERNSTMTSAEACVRQVITHWITEGKLERVGSESIRLNPAQHFREFVTLTRRADALERLCGHEENVGHTSALYNSPAGRKYIQEHLYNVIKSRFSVPVRSLPEDDPVRVILDHSPTTCQIVESVDQPPMILSKEDLLSFACAAGVSIDLLSNPTAILDSKLRQAVKKLYAQVAERLPKFERLIEELALVAGLSPDQAFEAMGETGRAKEKNEHGEVNIQQTVPSGKLDWLLVSLMYAGHRANERITVVRADFADLKIVAKDMPGMASEADRGGVFSISIDPRVQDSPSGFVVRGKASLDASRKRLSIAAYTLREMGDQGAMMLRVMHPGGPVPSSISLFKPSATVGDVIILRRAAEFIAQNELSVDIQVDGESVRNVSGLTIEPMHELFQAIPDITLDRLATIDEGIPVPWAGSKMISAELRQAGELSSVERIVAAQLAKTAESKVLVTSIAVRLATSERKIYQEWFLGFRSGGVGFELSFEEGAAQTKVVQDSWKAGDSDFKVQGYFKQSQNELIKSVVEWIGDKQAPFPLAFQSGVGEQEHFVKTVVELIRHRRVDRLWYIEELLTFTFRPASSAEQWEAEADYWSRRGDNARQELLEERLKDLQSKEPSGPTSDSDESLKAEDLGEPGADKGEADVGPGACEQEQ